MIISRDTAGLEWENCGWSVNPLNVVTIYA